MVGALALVPILVAGCGGSHGGACQVTLRAVPETKTQPITRQGMQIAQEVMTSRLAKIGVSSPKVTVHGDEVVIDFASVHDAAEATQIVGNTGLLQFFDFEPSLAPPTVTRNQQPAPLPSLYALLTAVQKEANSGSPQSYYLFKTTTSHQVLQGPAANLKELLLPYKDRKQPPNTQVLKVPANREPVSCGGIGSCPGAGRNGAAKSGEHWYLFKLPPELTGKDFVESGITSDIDPSTGQPIVTLDFTGHGSKEFKQLTEAEYNRGRVNARRAGLLDAHDPAIVNRYAGHNAIVLDGHLEETPYIDYTDPVLSQGIVGNAQITEPSTQEARRTALVLQSGSLPYRFQKVRLTNCSR